MTPLYSATSEKDTVRDAPSPGITLLEAIRLADLGAAVALLASPRAYTVARLAGGRLTVPRTDAFADGSGVADTTTERELTLPTAGSAAVFEARIFNRDAELRWLHTGRGLGTAVILSESPNPCARLAGPLDPLTATGTIENRYLLWGRPLGPHDEAAPTGPVWVRLAEARIGLLDVPLPRAPRRDECVFLRTVEYVTTEPAHGNSFVAEERLVGLHLDEPRLSAATGVGSRQKHPAEAAR